MSSNDDSDQRLSVPIKELGWSADAEVDVRDPSVVRRQRSFCVSGRDELIFYSCVFNTYFG